MSIIFDKASVAVIVLVIAVFTVHGWSLLYGGYYFLWWLDMVLHFSGGFTVGLFFVWMFYQSRFTERPVWRWYLFLMLISSVGVFVGALWEFIEFLFDAFIGGPASLLPAQVSIEDTMSDLFLDWMGALGAGALFLWWQKRKHSRHN